MSNLTQITDTLYAVVVPADENDFMISLSGKLWCESIHGDLIKHSAGYSGFKILGTVTESEISFNSCDIVEKWEIKSIGQVYKAYKSEVEFYISPETSFRSLLTSKGLFWENPMGTIEPMPLYYIEPDNWKIDLQRWQIQQVKKLSPDQKLLIIEKH